MFWLSYKTCKSAANMYKSGPVGSIIYVDLYGSIKSKFLVLIPVPINKDLCGSISINHDPQRSV